MTTQSHVLIPSADDIPTSFVHADDPLRGPTWSLSLDSAHEWSVHVPSPEWLRSLAHIAGELAETVESLRTEVAPS